MIQRNADAARLLRQRFQHRLPHPPHRIRNKFDALVWIELLHRLEQNFITDGNELGEIESVALIFFDVGDDKSEIGSDETLGSFFIAALHATRETTFFSGIFDEGKFLYVLQVLVECSGWGGAEKSLRLAGIRPRHARLPLKRELSVETAGEAAIWPRKPRANLGFPANPCKLTQFSTSQIVGFVGIPPFVHYPQNLWKMDPPPGKPMACRSIRRMSLWLWRGGKECGLRVNQDLTNRRLIDGHRPALSIVAVGTTKRARQRDANLSRAHLLVSAHRRDQIIDVTRVGPFDRQMQPFQNGADALRRPRCRNAECFSEPAFVDHANRHRFAVQHFVLRRRFDRMSHGVTEIQNCTLAFFTLILGDDRGLDFYRAPHDSLERGGVFREDRRVFALEKREILRVRDRAVLHGFGEPRRQLYARQRGEQLRIGDDDTWLMERTEQVFPGGHVDARLSANR